MLEHSLAELGLRDEWAHVLDGLRNGFDIGTTAPITKTLLYRNHKSSMLVRI